jgi:hypothetical protein
VQSKVGKDEQQRKKAGASQVQKQQSIKQRMIGGVVGVWFVGRVGLWSDGGIAIAMAGQPKSTVSIRTHQVFCGGESCLRSPLN